MTMTHITTLIGPAFINRESGQLEYIYALILNDRPDFPPPLFPRGFDGNYVTCRA